MTDQYITDMERGWEYPVRHLDMIDVDNAIWLIDLITVGCLQGLKNAQIATTIRNYGKAMTPEEKAERGLKASSRLSKTFYDALTEKGRADPVAASRAIVSRARNAGVWQRDREQYMNRHPSPGWRWATILHRGPECCAWAYENDQKELIEYPTLPVASCDKNICSCRAMSTPIKQSPTGISGFFSSIFRFIGRIFDLARIAIALVLTAIGLGAVGFLLYFAYKMIFRS